MVFINMTKILFRVFFVRRENPAKFFAGKSEIRGFRSGTIYLQGSGKITRRVIYNISFDS